VEREGGFVVGRGDVDDDEAGLGHVHIADRFITGTTDPATAAVAPASTRSSAHGVPGPAVRIEQVDGPSPAVRRLAPLPGRQCSEPEGLPGSGPDAATGSIDWVEVVHSVPPPSGLSHAIGCGVSRAGANAVTDKNYTWLWESWQVPGHQGDATRLTPR
jgi:hypothetical protein